MTSALEKAAPVRAFPFDNSYARLPQHFFARQEPSQAAEPWLIKLNEELAAQLGLDVDLLRREGAAIFSGNLLPEGAEPLAMAYAGHQFGGFVPLLGDGRAILLGEVIDRNGKRQRHPAEGRGTDTVFTPRRRACSTRAGASRIYRSARRCILSVSRRHGRSPQFPPASPSIAKRYCRVRVFTRVAGSHIRVGTFQFFAARGDAEGIKALADYVIERHYPELKAAENPYLALLPSSLRAAVRR
ncbi:protein adenylyltransferase SelO family protein [Rhizobium yanglingense]